MVRPLPKPPLSSFVAAALDPAFSETPFQPGQTGQLWRGEPNPEQPEWPQGPASVIWCAPYDTLKHSHPDLPQSHGQDDEPLACVDLTTEFDVEGRLARVQFEDYTLAETFQMTGMKQEARLVDDLLGRPAREACQALSHLIVGLFEATASV